MAINRTITDFILVVKGAGVQRIDQTLHEFFKGFYAAIRKLEGQGFAENVKVRMGRASKILSGFDYTPFYAEHDQKIVEITFDFKNITKSKDSDKQKETITNRRIWIKEAYWEPQLEPPGALKALFGEWHLTSFSFRKLFEDFFFPWHDGGGKYKSGKARNVNKWKAAFPGYFLYYFLSYLAVLGFIGMTGPWGASPLQTVFDIQRNVASAFSFLSSPEYFLPGLFGVALLAAFASAFRSWRVKSEGGGGRSKMPGLSSWVLWALVVAMIFQPLKYLLFWLAYFLFFVLPVILARMLAWGIRPNWYTDAPVEYFINENEKYLDYRYSRLEKIAQLIYRFFVVIGLPLALAVLLVSKLFLVLNIFGNDIGTKIDTSISSIVNLILGDVTAYALDPAQAASVQNVIEEEIKTFADLSLKEKRARVVDSIHVFAHSQGTPITYEALYHLLDDRYRKSLRSYLTIGSILNLHNQTNEVLDTVYWNRFPPDEDEYDKFDRGFKWFNFWNFTDPITQFTGLEPYRKARLKIDKKNEIERYTDGTPRLDFAPGSPFSIKTKDSIAKNHSEYWANVDEIHYPFVKHILRFGDKWLPDEWASPDIREKIEKNNWNENLIDANEYKRKYRFHHWLVFGLWLVFSAALFASSYLSWASISKWLSPFLKPFTITYAGVLPVAEGTWKSLLEYYYNQSVANYIILVLLVWVLLETAMTILKRDKQIPVNEEETVS